MKLILAWIALSVFLQVDGWRRRRRRRSPPPDPPPRPCQVGSWSSWSACSHQCGNAGTKSRSRSKTVTECCGGSCIYHLSETMNCNRNACRNGGTPTYGRCNCNAGWTGTCCERGRQQKDHCAFITLTSHVSTSRNINITTQLRRQTGCPKKFPSKENTLLSLYVRFPPSCNFVYIPNNEAYMSNYKFDAVSHIRTRTIFAFYEMKNMLKGTAHSFYFHAK